LESSMGKGGRKGLERGANVVPGLGFRV
jgi:hypothetical protein